MMLETMSEDSQQPFTVRAVSGEADTRLILRRADGTELVNEIVPAPFGAVTLSLPEVKQGEVCTLIVGDSEEEITMDNSAPEGFGGFGGMGGHGMKGEMPASDPENLPEDWQGRFENRSERPDRDWPEGMEPPAMDQHPMMGERQDWAGGERQPHQRPPEKQQ